MESSAVRVKQDFSPQGGNAVQKSKHFVLKINPKYYKQAYRSEWESMPDFKGWLKGVPGEPTRAYCSFCKKSLHAHRLSLLKHTSTLKHTRAAQKNFSQKDATEVDGKVAMEGQEKSEETITKPYVAEAKIVENVVIAEADGKVAEDASTRETESEPSQTAKESSEAPITPIKRMQTRSEMATSQAGGPLSTHILDTARGNPVGGLQVSLYKLIDGRWTHISEGLTNPDGRYSHFIQKADFTAGRYKLHFDVDRYFELRKLESLYPFIEIVFDVKSPQDHYHVPLLLSPFGYTTYRGS